MPRNFQISLLTNCATAHVAGRAVLPLEAFLASFTNYQAREEKNGGAWSPILWRGDYRASENFESACALVYDLDWDDREDREALLEALDTRLAELGVAFAIHETFTASRYRLVIPLAEDLSEFDYQSAWADTLNLLGLTNTEDESGKFL